MSRRAGKGLLDANASEQLGQIDERLARLDAELRARIQEAEQQVIQQAWQEELAKPAGSTVQRAVILSGNQLAAISGSSVVVSTGSGGAPLTGGLIPATQARAFEFGALDPQGHIGHVRASARAQAYQRHTQRQMPTRSQTGWVAFPAAKRLGKRLAELLQATIVKFTHDALDGGR
jgi:hypothetical protein